MNLLLLNYLYIRPGMEIRGHLQEGVFGSQEFSSTFLRSKPVHFHPSFSSNCSSVSEFKSRLESGCIWKALALLSWSCVEVTSSNLGIPVLSPELPSLPCWTSGFLSQSSLPVTSWSLGLGLLLLTPLFSQWCVFSRLEAAHKCHANSSRTSLLWIMMIDHLLLLDLPALLSSVSLLDLGYTPGHISASVTPEPIKSLDSVPFQPSSRLALEADQI